MQIPLCARCGKNYAVVFIQKVENGETKTEGLCIQCAREMGIQPMNDLIKSMGLTEDDLEQLGQQMGALQEMLPEEAGDHDGEGTTSFADALFGGGAPQSEEETGEGEGAAPTRKERRKNKKSFLDQYCTDLTAQAAEGKIDRMVGRESELRRVEQILNRRQKNNPCLIGEPGVGKTAIAEGLAQRIVDGTAPYKLLDKQVYLLDLTSLVAGTQFRGQFESRMKGLIDEIRKKGNVILVIDEVHNLVGAGDAEGSMNAANILKPALSRGEIQVIGATTFAEYRKHIEKDSALERRFQPVTVGEPSLAEATEILKGVRGYYEQFHHVRVPDEMCRQAVLLSERYINDRYLPDKAIDLLDEACSQMNLENVDLAEQAKLEKQIETFRQKQEELLQAEQSGQEENQQLYAEMAQVKSLQAQAENRLHQLQNQQVPVLRTAHLAAVIELWTHIPASRICQKESQRLRQLEERLSAHIIGQEEAVRAVAAAVRRSRAGVSAKKKPISFLFVGPTGVGKTELVRRLAEDLFDTPDSLIRLDMSEYMEKHAVSRIVGSPPGYVGYDEAGQLTEKIRRRPYSVVLFDEIEKAHPDVLNILLQVLDDGRITDAHGRQVSFENTVLVMTSNAGSEQGAGALGFGGDVVQQDKDKALRALESFLRPEFINRIDEIIAFRHLDEGDFAAIARLMLAELQDNLKEQGLSLAWDAAVPRELTRLSYSIKYGARNLRRTIQKEIEDPMATLIIDRAEGTLTGFELTVREGKIAVQALS